jgi:peptide/nickel transport system substrate-binding protein
LSGVGNAEIDAMLRKPGTMADRAQAIAAANEAESAALHLYGIFPLWNGPRMVAVTEGLANSPAPAGFQFPSPEDIGWQKGTVR